MQEKPWTAHKWVAALNRGEGVTYLSGKNQQAAYQPPDTSGALPILKTEHRTPTDQKKGRSNSQRLYWWDT